MNDYLKDIQKKPKRNIKACNLENNDDIKYFKSKNQCAKYFGCSPSLIYQICENKYSKNNYKNVTFTYNEDVNINYTIIPDARLGRSKYTPEEKRILRNHRARMLYKKKCNNLI